MPNNEWIEAVRDCIVAISASLNSTAPHLRSVQSERALDALTNALVLAGEEVRDAK